MPEANALRQSLEAIVGPARVLDRPVERVAFAADAGFYRLIPQAVVFAESVAEVQGLFQFSRKSGIPMTFRAAGTSLSGQAISDGILVEVARHWRGIQVLEGGARIKVQPGVIGAHVNHALRPFRAKMGPDPASIATCTVGGILSNNSSGMCCGVIQNAYHTLDSLTFVLPSGTVIDTAAADADEQFRKQEPALAQGLLDLKAEIEANAVLAARIRAKYRMKNTTGYSLNAFMDYARPVDIFRNLLVGSEGTLAFISEAVLRTVPDLPVKVTGLLLFPDLRAACRAIAPLKEAGAAALELLDRGSLRSVQDQPGVPERIRELPEGAAALLAEFQGAAEDQRDGLARTALEVCAGLPLLDPAAFTHAPAEQDRLWKVRRGIIPSAGSLRARGTSVILEDVAFPPEHLADAALDLSALFLKHGYPDATVFGHAKDGNLHFVITQAFDTAQAVDQYRRFIDDVVDLVVNRYHGSLKAEHGTGRNMAPFVEAEWGTEAKAVMAKLKALVDPDFLLNPGVILNADPKGRNAGWQLYLHAGKDQVVHRDLARANGVACASADALTNCNGGLPMYQSTLGAVTLYYKLNPWATFAIEQSRYGTRMLPEVGPLYDVAGKPSRVWQDQRTEFDCPKTGNNNADNPTRLYPEWELEERNVGICTGRIIGSGWR